LMAGTIRLPEGLHFVLPSASKLFKLARETM